MNKLDFQNLKQNIHLAHTSKHQRQVLDTGFEALNGILAVGGWPLATTTEVCLPNEGIGEMRLLFPSLRHVMESSSKDVILIAPPFVPHARALLKEQLDITKLTIVETRNKADILWCAEQALTADCCAAVLTWTGSNQLTQRETRRLQLATERTHAWHVQFRHSDCLQQSSSAQLRLHLQADADSRLKVVVKKQPQSWAGRHCTVSIPPHYERWQRVLMQACTPQTERVADREAIPAWNRLLD